MGIKTTIAAFIILMIGLGLVAALIFVDTFTTQDFAISMNTLAAFGTTVIGFLAKDQNKSHTQLPK